MFYVHSANIDVKGWYNNCLPESDSLTLITQPPPGQPSWESAGLLSRSLQVRTSAGPTLRVLKWLRRKCCLCNNIYNWLDFSVFSRIRTKNYKPGLTALSLIWFLWDVKEPTPLEKSRGRRPQWCDQLSHIIHIIGWVGTVLKLINGLRAAASGTFVWCPSLLFTC